MSRTLFQKTFGKTGASLAAGAIVVFMAGAMPDTLSRSAAAWSDLGEITASRDKAEDLATRKITVSPSRRCSWVASRSLTSTPSGGRLV